MAVVKERYRKGSHLGRKRKDVRRNHEEKKWARKTRRIEIPLLVAESLDDESEDEGDDEDDESAEEEIEENSHQDGAWASRATDVTSECVVDFNSFRTPLSKEQLVRT